MIKSDNYLSIRKELDEKGVTLVAVSKTKPADEIQELYDMGQRDFGENYVQELIEKQSRLPQDVRWHFIGHLQSNKVKYIAPFVYLIHGVDSIKLLSEINKQAAKNNRVIHVLLQVHIAKEETKFGLDETELKEVLDQNLEQISNLQHIHIDGFMGMASFTHDQGIVRQEFRYLKSLFDQYKNVQTGNINLHILSMGMSGDYRIAVEEGSTMVRIGSLIFGERK
jgi:PLP dependent protein